MVLNEAPVWQEVVSFFGRLAPKDLAHLSATAKWGSRRKQDRVDLWRGYFVLRWGTEYGATSKTQVRFIRSWDEVETWSSTFLLAAGFCAPRSALEHSFWLLPLLRTILMQCSRPKRPPASQQGQAWQVACYSRHDGTRRILRCFVCDVLEVVPLGPMPQHFRQHWVLPCAHCRRFAHSACLERQLMAKSGASSGAGDDGERLNLRCDVCQREYRASRRFAESLPELLAATRLEWRWALRRFSTAICFFFWIYMLAGHYLALNGFSSEVCVLLAFTATIMSITVCPRFHQGVQMIWNTPNRWRYLRLFGLYSLLCHLAVFRVLDPNTWARLAGQNRWLRHLHELHVLAHGSLSGTIFLMAFSLVYLASTSGVIFLFWKTSLRVPTVASMDVHEHNLLPAASRGSVPCGLCQLGLCLDNEVM